MYSLLKTNNSIEEDLPVVTI